LSLVYSILILIKKLVGWLVALLLGWMVLLGLLQVVLRWIFSTGIVWADPQLRLLVLWVGLLGGVLAAAESRHIRIDIVEHYLDERLRRISKRVISTLAGVASLCLCYVSISFISSEKAAELMHNSLLFGSAVPAWVTELVIPFSFCLMGLFFLIEIPEKSSATVGEPES